jgi:hypothetical protein
MICPLKEIPVKGGATLKINGGFKLNCIGDGCQIYSDACYENVYGALSKMRHEVNGEQVVNWKDIQHFFDRWAEVGK